MRNQHSFRITKELRPSDMKVSVSKVLNKVDEDGRSFYPNYERPITVALQSADGKVFETTKATADGAGILNFEIRGLPDDSSLDGVEAFRKHWNPGTICIVTMASQDLIGLGSYNERTGENTFHENVKFKKDVEVEGDLKVEKPIEAQGGVKIPEYDSVEDATSAITEPYAGMQIVIQGEIYKRNNMYERWEVLAQGEPVPIASKIIPGSVMLANEEDMAEGRDMRGGKPVVVQPSKIPASGSLTEKIFPLGESVSKNDFLYLKSDGKLYKTDASDASKLPTDDIVRIAQIGGSANEVIPVSFKGERPGFSGLTAGDPYYLSNTPGKISNIAGTNPMVIGKAIDGNTILIRGYTATNPGITIHSGSGSNSTTSSVFTENGTFFYVLRINVNGSGAYVATIRIQMNNGGGWNDVLAKSQGSGGFEFFATIPILHGVDYRVQYSGNHSQVSGSVTLLSKFSL